MSKDPTIRADLLIRLLSPETPFDERKAAVVNVAVEAWGAGWDACYEETLALMKRFRDEELLRALGDMGKPN